MKIICFDTETNGLPMVYTKPYQENYPRLLELSFITYDTKTTERKDFSFFIKPEGFKVKEGLINGLNQEILENKGENIKDVLAFFLSCVKESELIVCHNVQFDTRVILGELERLNFSENPFAGMKSFCTMERTKWLFEGKRQKLANLYKYLFGEYYQHQHTAHSDTEATLKIFLQYKNDYNATNFDIL